MSSAPHGTDAPKELPAGITMLGRTASGLFWMMRYLERMENTARLVEAGFRMSLTRSRTQRSEWESVLSTASAKTAYLEAHDDYRTASVVDFLLADRNNPGSVASSLALARQNARMTRTALTRDTWEAINDAWLQITDALSGALSGTLVRRDLPDLLGLIRQQAALVRGTINGTMLRNDIFRFIELGVLVERADNTARILDTKYYVLLPSSASVGSSLDHVQWEMILRSASAERSFHWLHGGDITPAAIVDFLVHDTRVPRSIAFCYDAVVDTLTELDRCYDRTSGLAVDAARIRDHVRASSSETIIGTGLHEFLLDLIERNAALSARIGETYRFQS
ncbi:MAG: alpha-E domain-containing protein [Litorimonas sp.]